jgi:hypothetical protein
VRLIWAGVCALSVAPVVTQGAVDRRPNACRSGLDCSMVPRQKPLDCTVLHLPDMDFRNSANSNFLSNIVSEFGSTNFVECLVRLQTKPADDDFLLDLGSAAEDRLWAPVARLGSRRARNTVFLVAIYGPTGSLRWPVGELVQVGPVAADADAGLGCPSGKRRTGRSDMSSRFLPRR